MTDGMEKLLLRISGQVCLREKEALKKYWRWLLTYSIHTTLTGKGRILKELSGLKLFYLPI